MIIERLTAGIQHHPVRWRVLGIALVLGALAATSFVPAVGSSPPAAVAEPVVLEDETDGGPLWASVSLDTDGFRELTFEHLNDFRYQPPGGARIDYLEPAIPEELGRPFEERVPERIRDLDDQKVAIAGFIMPLAGTPEAMTMFALVRNISICCYGVTPLLTEWILVEAEPEQKIRYHRNIPVVLRGVLELDEEVEDGFVVCLLKMSADDLVQLDRLEFRDFYERTGAL
jgi:hypothetical protein